MFQTPATHGLFKVCSVLNFGHLNLEFVSNFGFRASNLSVALFEIPHTSALLLRQCQLQHLTRLSGFSQSLLI
jgi:hypothetical protein